MLIHNLNAIYVGEGRGGDVKSADEPFGTPPLIKTPLLLATLVNCENAVLLCAVSLERKCEHDFLERRNHILFSV